MSAFLQYFNIEKMGRFPNGADALLTTGMGVYSKLAAVKQAKGGTVYVISGFGKPKRYVLWEAFTIEEIAEQDGQFVVSGPGKVLLPPAELSGKDFDKFRAACANFIGFRKIDDQKYTETLAKLAAANGKTELSPACVKFCDGLVAAFPKMGDAYYYRAHTRQHLGRTAALLVACLVPFAAGLLWTAAQLAATASRGVHEFEWWFGTMPDWQVWSIVLACLP